MSRFDDLPRASDALTPAERLRTAFDLSDADLLFASSGIEPEVVAAAEPVDLAPGLALRVARAGHLIALKLLSRDDVRRPQDRVDLASLLASAVSSAMGHMRFPKWIWPMNPRCFGIAVT